MSKPIPVSSMQTQNTPSDEAKYLVSKGRIEELKNVWYVLNSFVKILDVEDEGCDVHYKYYSVLNCILEKMNRVMEPLNWKDSFIDTF